MTDVTAQTAKPIARPLRVLVPLIQKDLSQGHEAAERAGLPYYRAAGEKMLEAKPQMAHVEFKAWLKRHFDVSYSHAARYMSLAGAGPEVLLQEKYTSLSDFIRQTSSPTYNRPHSFRPYEQKQRAEAIEAQRKLALQLIDVGFRTLAAKFHPDKGGTQDTMVQLNYVRGELQRFIKTRLK